MEEKLEILSCLCKTVQNAAFARIEAERRHKELQDMRDDMIDEIQEICSHKKNGKSAIKPGMFFDFCEICNKTFD